MRDVKSYLLRQRAALLLLAGALAVFWVVAALYSLPMEPFGYATVLVLAGGALLLGIDGAQYMARCRAVRQLNEQIAAGGTAALEILEPSLPFGGETGLEAEYRRTLALLAAARREADVAARAARGELLDYFTLWVHQIKTPLAAMHLLLQAEGGSLHCRAEMEAELFKTEQYVGMVLTYLRLGSENNDLVLEITPLDPVVRDAIHKFAPMFVLKKLTLDYPGTGAAAATDRKWLGFILEQLLSNAIKYTPEGGKVTITADARSIAVIDTGIGVRAEDLPRIFEKGYTGYNGHENSRSTGLGLYLCSVAAGLLGATLRAESPLGGSGGGTRVVLRLPGQPGSYE